MIAVPVEFLLRGRAPDLELHRMVALYGPLTTPELKARSRLAYYVIDNTMRRLERHRLVSATRILANYSKRPVVLQWRITSHGQPADMDKFRRRMLTPKAA